MGMCQSILINASSMTKQLPEMYQSKQLNAELASIQSDNDDDGYESDFSDDEIEDEEWKERLLILQDASKLARLADFFLNPHKPVVTLDPYACGRNYYSRPSAYPQEMEEEDEERALIMEEMKQLKQLAMDYLHPERPVITTDPCACGRNYFTRPSAPQYESAEDTEERNQILKEASLLKQLAVDYLHPERSVVTTDPFACGRNYFTRPSAPQYEDDETSAERELILKDASLLRQLAVDYLHPERPVVTTDPFACGHNYFTRPSAPKYEDDETSAERELIMKDANLLKKLAVDYLHPERPVVTTDPFACGRNYFSRLSAPQYEDEADAAERELILKDANLLKKLAVDYLHPERPVVTTDPFACGRNYFTRPSAPQYEDEADAAERELILKDANLLKRLAVDYLHPERPVVTTDPFACGRNYFTRASAPQFEQEDLELERELIMDDVEHLKELAHEYLCREVPHVSTVPMADKVVAPSTPIIAEASDPACVLFVGMNY